MDFVKAIDIHHALPKEYPRIPKERLDRLKEEEAVRVMANAEGLVIRIKLISGDIVSGLVASIPLVESHGFKHGDPVIFTKDKIYSIYENKQD